MKNTCCELYLGIDLGTTNSVAATVDIQNGKIRTPILKTERPTKMLNSNRTRSGKGHLLPSCVLYQKDTNEESGYNVMVGDLAKEISRTRPYTVATSVKSQMGESKLNYHNWEKENPDQTPEDVSARILKHFKDAVYNELNEEIKDVVITVPANFNTAQKEATLLAAEKAGFNVRTENGEFKDNILLSEPEAVVYDVINQIQNGEIHIGIDFSEPKKILVFDIGGGTLDITLHTIVRNKESSDIFDISPIATNRYSVIAGDTFDRTIANLMNEKYLDSLRHEGEEVYRRAVKEEEGNIRILMAYAEEIKIAISEKYKNLKNRERVLSKNEEFEYGGEMHWGYSCEDFITVEEFEKCLESLMGYKYSYDDYKKMSKVTDEKNIIYPILNVLDKATKNLGVDEIKVDGVILNGGMSRLYLIENRLEEFFKVNIIKCNDPDRSVAQGAAVYHYHMSTNSTVTNEEIQNNKLNTTIETEEFQTVITTQAKEVKKGFTDLTQPVSRIYSTKSIQNEDLYIGLRGGTTVKLIEAGTELPFVSEKLNFSIMPNQENLQIPIKELVGKEYKTIAVGNIFFKNTSTYEKTVDIRFTVNRSGLMGVDAWLDGEVIGTLKLALGQVEDKYKTKGGKVAIPPAGTILIVANEISAFKHFVDQIKDKKLEYKKFESIGKIKSLKKTICNCGNPQDFALPILKILGSDDSTDMRMNIIPVARALCKYWTEEQCKELSKVCISILYKELNDWEVSSMETTANIEAIKAIGICKNENHCKELVKLCKKYKYRNALLYAFGVSGFNGEWVIEEFNQDIALNRSMQDSLKSLGMNLYNTDKNITPKTIKTLTKKICQIVESGDCNYHEISLSLITLGLTYRACNDIKIKESIKKDIQKTLNNIVHCYGKNESLKTIRSQQNCMDLINEEIITEENENYLLSFLFES